MEWVVIIVCAGVAVVALAAFLYGRVTRLRWEREVEGLLGSEVPERRCEGIMRRIDDAAAMED